MTKKKPYLCVKDPDWNTAEYEGEFVLREAQVTDGVVYIPNKDCDIQGILLSQAHFFTAQMVYPED